MIMERKKLRAWDHADGVNRDKGCMSYYKIGDPIGDVDVIMEFCDCEDAEGNDVFEGDLIVDSYSNKEGKFIYRYYPVGS